MLTFNQFKRQYYAYFQGVEKPEIKAFFQATEEEPEFSYCIQHEEGDIYYTASFEEAYDRYLQTLVSND